MYSVDQPKHFRKEKTMSDLSQLQTLSVKSSFVDGTGATAQGSCVFASCNTTTRS